MDEQATFEPQSVLGTRRVGWYRLAAIMPALALALVTWIGINGPRSGPETRATHTPGAVPSRGPAAVAAGEPETPSPPRPGDLPYPTTLLGLPVRTLEDVARERVNADIAVAVAGWYSAGPASACPDPIDLAGPGLLTELGYDDAASPFCRRWGVLVPRAPFQTADAPLLPVVVTPGTVVPEGLGDAGGLSVPVVFVGRIVDPGPICDFRGGCGPTLLVDRVPWAAGRAQVLTTSILPSLLDVGPRLTWRPRNRLADEAVGSSGPILFETLVDPATLVAVDSAAAAAVAALAPDAERIWYRRELGPDPELDGLRWVAIDGKTGEVITGGLVAQPTQP